MEKKLSIIAFTTIQILCGFVASYCALHDGDVLQSTVLTIILLLLALLCEYIKCKITHNNN